MSFPPPGGADPYQPQQPDASNPYAQPVPPPPAYQQPYGQSYPQFSQPISQKTNGMAIASMSTGIGSIVLCFCCPLLPILAGGTGLALGLVSMKQIKQRGDGGKGMAIAGIATSAVGIVLGIVQLVLVGFDIADAFNSGMWDGTDWDE